MMGQHLQHLAVAFEVLQQQQLFANKKKCLFWKRQIDSLGHVISAEGVATDSAKIRAMCS